MDSTGLCRYIVRSDIDGVGFSGCGQNQLNPTKKCVFDHCKDSFLFDCITLVRYRMYYLRSLSEKISLCSKHVGRLS